MAVETFTQMFAALDPKNIATLVSDMTDVCNMNAAMNQDFVNSDVLDFSGYAALCTEFNERDRHIQAAIMEFNQKYPGVSVRTYSHGNGGIPVLSEDKFFTNTRGEYLTLIPKKMWKPIQSPLKVGGERWISVDIRSGTYEDFYNSVGSKIEEWGRLSDNYTNRNVMRADEAKVRTLLRDQDNASGSDVSYVNGEDYLFHMRRMNVDEPWAWLPGFGNDWAKQKVTPETLSLAQKVFVYCALKGYSPSK